MRTIAVRVGELRQVVPASLQFYVEVVARDTVAAGAAVELELVDARVACCGDEWSPPSFRCGRCGAAAAVVAGDEFEVESIVIEEGEACTAHT